MKKLMTIVGSVVLLSAVSVVFMNNSKDDSNASLLMRNVEALADNEFDYDNGKSMGPFECGNGGCTTNVVWCDGGGSGCSPRRCSVHDN